MFENNSNFQIVKTKEILTEHNLAIPEYQRPYTWSVDSALILLMDTFNAFLNNEDEYRIGTVVLFKDKKGKLNIVDGQQRLTTISIIFYILGKLTKTHKYENLSSLLDSYYNNLSIKAIVDNAYIIEHKLKEHKNEELQKYAIYLLENCTYVRIYAKSEQEAFQFFDSQNSRGKELNPHDLLKSYHLREMNDENITEKCKIVNYWEDMNQNELNKIFSEQLFPLIRWFKNKNAQNYSTKDIKYFKGIKRNNKYNFSNYHKAVSLYFEQIESNKNSSQFQLTQPIIDGKYFFEYISHYVELYYKISKLILDKSKQNKIVLLGNLITNNNEEQLEMVCNGDIYVHNLFINVLMFFVDKFDFNSLTDARLFFLYKWAFSLRLCLHSVYKESVNKYALGKNTYINQRT